MARRNNHQRTEPTVYKATPSLFIPPAHKPGRAWSPREAVVEAIVEAQDLAREDAIVERPIVAAVREAVEDKGATLAAPAPPTPSQRAGGRLVARCLRTARLSAVKEEGKPPFIAIHFLELDEATARHIADTVGANVGRDPYDPRLCRVLLKRARAVLALTIAADHLDDATRVRVAHVVAELDALGR